MAVRILGPVRLAGDGGVTAPAGYRQHVVLAMLALNANRVVSTDQLIDALWPDGPPETARAQVQISVSGLRKQLMATECRETIRTDAPGYALATDAAGLDSLRLDDLASKARVHEDSGNVREAFEALDSARALWRGPALDGVDSGPVRRAATWLDERRMDIEIERIRLAIDSFRQDEVMADLRALLNECPLREQLHQYMMIALYRCGRQSEALEVYRRTRAMLIEEVGVEPSQELRDIEAAVLRGDLPTVPPQAAAPAEASTCAAPAGCTHDSVPSLLPASVPDFVGRRGELAVIREGVACSGGDTARTGVRIAALIGKPGIGKSALAMTAAHELAPEFTDGVLYADFDGEPGTTGVEHAVLRFLRALGVADGAIPDDPAQRVDLYRSRLAGRRVLIVLDDVGSADQVSALLPSTPASRVILTSRVPLSVLPGLRRVTVGDFADTDALELLGEIIGSDRIEAERDAAESLVRLCAGSPLAIRLAGAKLAARPHWRIADLHSAFADDSRRLDELRYGQFDLRARLAASCRRLPERCVKLFRRLSVLGQREFPGWAAAAVLDTELADGLELLEMLVDAQLVDVLTTPSRDRSLYRINELLRIYAAELLSSSEPEEAGQAAVQRWQSGRRTYTRQLPAEESGGEQIEPRGTTQGGRRFVYAESEPKSPRLVESSPR